MTDVAVVKVEPVSGVVTKRLNGSFGTDVRYTLDDGRTVDTAYTSTRKRDVLPGVADLNLRAEHGRVEACFDDDGTFICTGVRYGI